MLKTEAAHDGAAPAMETKSDESGLYSRVMEGLKDPTTVAIAVGGTAAVVAAAKFGGPLVAKAFQGAEETAKLDPAWAKNLIDGLPKDGLQKVTYDHPQIQALLEKGVPMTSIQRTIVDEFVARNAAAIGTRPGETGILGIVRNGKIEPATDALLANGKPLSRAEVPVYRPNPNFRNAYTEGDDGLFKFFRDNGAGVSERYLGAEPLPHVKSMHRIFPQASEILSPGMKEALSDIGERAAALRGVERYSAEGVRIAEAGHESAFGASGSAVRAELRRSMQALLDETATKTAPRLETRVVDDAIASIGGARRGTEPIPKIDPKTIDAEIQKLLKT